MASAAEGSCNNANRRCSNVKYHGDGQKPLALLSQRQFLVLQQFSLIILWFLCLGLWAFLWLLSVALDYSGSIVHINGNPHSLDNPGFVLGFGDFFE